MASQPPGSHLNRPAQRLRAGRPRATQHAPPNWLLSRGILPSECKYSESRGPSVQTAIDMGDAASAMGPFFSRLHLCCGITWMGDGGTGVNWPPIELITSSKAGYLVLYAKRRSGVRHSSFLLCTAAWRCVMRKLAKRSSPFRGNYEPARVVTPPVPAGAAQATSTARSGSWR
jgi:hypothetical protein